MLDAILLNTSGTKLICKIINIYNNSIVLDLLNTIQNIEYAINNNHNLLLTHLIIKSDQAGIDELKLNTVLYEQIKNMIIGGEEVLNKTNMCSICLYSFVDAPYITSCCHMFHKECVDKWIDINKNKTNILCPECKYHLFIKI